MLRKELSQNYFPIFRIKTKKVLENQGLSAGVVRLTSKDGAPPRVSEAKRIDNRFRKRCPTKQGVPQASVPSDVARLCGSDLRTQLSKKARVRVPEVQKQKPELTSGCYFLVHLHGLAKRKGLIIVFASGVRQSKECHKRVYRATRHDYAART